SERRYFRLYGNKNDTVIATVGANVPENEAFVYFSKHFKEKALHVPEIFHINDDRTIYLQEDFGGTSLLNVLEEKGFCDDTYNLFRESLHQLARLQVMGDEGLDYEKCLTNKEFGKQAILADLLYFKYYFLDALRKPYDKQKLIDDFDALSTYLTFTEFKYFMFRDFQSRNIMVKEDGSVHFIDFQGGMKGAPQYDVASAIWQARANLPDEWKHNLLEDYMNSFESIIQKSLDRAVFQSQYNGYVLIRLLQVLGAYGFRGLFERKAQFLTAIPLALNNLHWFVANHSMGIAVPEFRKVLDICIDDEIIRRFTPVQADENTPLVVKICSFSYRKGIPVDDSGNGGGFVFDMRGIDNPGRHEQYKMVHGRDRVVMEYLERQTRMQDFLNSVFDIIDISVEEYIKRGFTSLVVNFGCTGGQHRSVYAADALARHLKNKYKVKVQVCHIEQEAKGWRNPMPELK
ncbi:MAG: phosphotransferase, partial [Flavisolibacter sp.]|nr:phosphotransferase [Flavisolibacter sp.]